MNEFTTYTFSYIFFLLCLIAPLSSHLILDWLTYFVLKTVSAVRTAIQLLLLNYERHFWTQCHSTFRKDNICDFFSTFFFFNRKELPNSLVLLDSLFCIQANKLHAQGLPCQTPWGSVQVMDMLLGKEPWRHPIQSPAQRGIVDNTSHLSHGLILLDFQYLQGQRFLSFSESFVAVLHYHFGIFFFS